LLQEGFEVASSGIRVGIVQFESGKRPEESLERLRRLLEGARIEADIILLPEYSNITPAMPLDVLRSRVSSVEDDSFLHGIRVMAFEYNTAFMAGVIERGENGCLYSSVVAVSPKDKVRVIYRKRFLFDALGFNESRILCKGDRPLAVVNVKGVRVGAALCFELRFPEIFRAQALCGAQLISVHAAWYRGDLKEEQLMLLARARANENTVYIALVNQYGKLFTGRSMLVDPTAVVTHMLGARWEYREAPIDLDVLREAREKLPLLRIISENDVRIEGLPCRLLNDTF